LVWRRWDYIVYVVWLCIECGIIWKLFVETKGPSLEAVAAMFDGDAVKEVYTDGFGDKERKKTSGEE